MSHRTANDDQVQLEERATDGYATKQSANCDCKSVQSTGQLGQSLEACPHRETRALEPARCLAVHVGRRGLVSRTLHRSQVEFRVVLGALSSRSDWPMTFMSAVAHICRFVRVSGMV